MRPAFLIFLMLWLAIAFSCGHKLEKIVYENTAHGIERKTFDYNGDVTEDIQLGKDSIKSGYYKTFRLGKLSSQSQIKNINGVPLFVAYNRNNIKPNEEFEAMYFFGVPPTFSYQLNIREINVVKKNTLFETTISDTTAPVQNLYLGKKYSIKKKEAESGIYDWIITFILKDGKQKNILIDTSSIRVFVKS